MTPGEIAVGLAALVVIPLLAWLSRRRRKPDRIGTYQRQNHDAGRRMPSVTRIRGRRAVNPSTGETRLVPFGDSLPNGEGWRWDDGK